MKISKADCPEMIKDTTPVQDGFFMQGEFEQDQGMYHDLTAASGSWRNGAKEAETAFSAVIRAQSPRVRQCMSLPEKRGLTMQKHLRKV